MKKRFSRILLCAGMCTALAAGASMTGYAASNGTEAASAAGTSEEGQRPPKEDDGVMAKITAVSDDSLTVSTAQKPEMGEKPANGETPSEKPADGETPGMSANPTIHGNLVIHTFVCPQIKRYQRF